MKNLRRMSILIMYLILTVSIAIATYFNRYRLEVLFLGIIACIVYPFLYLCEVKDDRNLSKRKDTNSSDKHR